jgi:Spy/CpxP family protein refolding chaperone
MSQLRGLRWSLGLAVLLLPLGAARAAEPVKPKEEPNARQELPNFSFLERMQHLLVPGAQEQLNLTSQQLDQLKKMEYDFRSQRRDMLMKLADDLINKCREKDEEGEEQFDMGKGALTVFTGLLRLRGLRDGFEVKAWDLLTADQKKQYAHLQDEWLRRFSEGRGQHVRAHGEMRVFDSRCQEHLKLTAEQRQKLEQLHKDMDSKLKTILTDEQYRQVHMRHQRQQHIRQEGQSDAQPANRDLQRGEDKAPPK